MLAFIILILLGCVLFLPLKAVAVYKEKSLNVKLYLSGILIFKISLPDKESSEKKKTPSEKTKQVEKETKKLGDKIKYYAGLYKNVVWLLRKYVNAEEIEVNINIGTGEAATTAVSTGILWGAIYGLLGIIGNYIYIDKHNVAITPIYSNAVFSFNGKCIIKSRVAYIIIIIITLLKSRRNK